MINITKYSSWISITIGIWMGLHTVNLSAQLKHGTLTFDT